MNSRFNFRAWVPVLYYNKNGDDCETIMCIENVAVYSDGAVGCSENDLDTAIINLNLSELDEASVRGYIEDNYSTESDLWYFFDNGNIIPEQCTGLKDKNGNLIYEGDVIDYFGEPAAIVWDYCGLKIKTNDDICHEFYRNGIEIINNVHNTGIKIIGNIHEQAEQKDK